MPWSWWSRTPRRTRVEITSGSMLDPPATTRWTESRKVVEVQDPALQEVPDALGSEDEQLQSAGGVDVLRQDDHRDVRQLAPDLQRGRDPVAGEGGRHPDVGHDDVGVMRPDLLEEIVAVARLSHHLEPLVPEDAGDPLLGGGRRPRR